MAYQPTPATNPSLYWDAIEDQQTRQSFQNLEVYFRQQNQLYGFNFFELNFTAAQANATFSHGLAVIPQDVLVSRITGTGSVTFNFGLMTSSLMNLTVTGPCRIRFYIGTYWNYTQSAATKSTDTQTFSATPSSGSTSSYVNKAPNFTVLTSGTRFGISYYFTITGGTATAGAVYTHNGFSYTVVDTITSGSFLLCRSTGAPLSSGQLLKSSGTGTILITFTAFQAPLYMVVEVVGAGGGGGSASATAAGTNSGGAGGGGGQYAKKRFVNLSAVYTYSIGVGGAGGTAGGNGAGGGNTVFASMTANGGGGGVGAGTTASGPVFISGAGGGGGAGGTGGDFSIPGGQGSPAIVLGIGQASYGAGGQSLYGIMSQAGLNAGTTPGITGNNYGAGGSGALAFASQGAQTGGPGGPGVAFVWEYFQ